MTFAVLKQLHSIIGTAIDEIEQVYNEADESLAGIPRSPTSVHQSPSKTSLKGSLTVKTGGGGAGSYVSPPPSPLIATTSATSLSADENTTGSTTKADSSSSRTASLDWPSLDLPHDPASQAEMLTAHPVVNLAVGRIIAAAGQLTATVQTPFLSLCDASMCVRIVFFRLPCGCCG
jgi:hypothetical protein